MPIVSLSPAELRLTLDPASLGFTDTSELIGEPLPWIGQARAEAAARFGLGMDQPNYNLFVLGEVGSGRSSLLKQAMHEVAASKRVPPDLCYLHNFDAPERPLALRLPAGEGRLLRQSLAQAVKTLQSEIPQRLEGQDYKAESERIEKAWKDDVAQHYAKLTAFAEARSFSLHREAGRMVFTLIGKKGQALTEDEVLALPKARRAAVEQGEQELRAEITRPCPAKEADQGRHQTQCLARCAGTGRIRQSGAVQRRRRRGGPAGSAGCLACALPRQPGGRQRRIERRAGDRRGQSAVPCVVRQHRIPVRERRADDRFFAHPCRQPTTGAWRLSDAAFA